MLSRECHKLGSSVRACLLDRTKPGQLPELEAMVEGLADRVGVPVPRLYLVPLRAAERVRDLLAREFGHIKNRDILVSTIAAMVAAAISAIASILQFSLLFGGSDEEDLPLGLIGTLGTIILAPVAAMLLRLAVSRQREDLADATGAQLFGHAAPLADALATLEQDAQASPMNVNPATASLSAINPLARQEIATLSMTHTPIAERIRRLPALDGERVIRLAA